MNNDTVYLFMAFGLSWMVIFGFIFKMLKSQKLLEVQIQKIKETLERYQDDGN
ncbi:MAG: hypothetical protein JRH18_21095 [Deltaproteobacteria bacterium]|nr:hypothetical protein [Deltaproteobacteria bacterium]MBW1996301.1 hypothetical protein [Deltaproteobacteria bacterium]MBW2154149.1 hypothetical protein [Deltaproteobacteria bacterium]